MNALERAIEVLSGAGTKTALRQMDKPRDELTLLRTAAAVYEAVKYMPEAHQLSPEQLSMLSPFYRPSGVPRSEGSEEGVLLPGVGNDSGHPQGHVVRR